MPRYRPIVLFFRQLPMSVEEVLLCHRVNSRLCPPFQTYTPSSASFTNKGLWCAVRIIVLTFVQLRKQKLAVTFLSLSLGGKEKPPSADSRIKKKNLVFFSSVQTMSSRRQSLLQRHLGAYGVNGA